MTVLRPRLADHVAVRRHRVAGEVVIALHDARADRIATVGEREWILLSMADGTRDADGILAAAGRAGRHARREHLTAFLDQLDAAGMLAEGPSPHPGDEARPVGDVEGEGASTSELGVRGMPGLTLRCDGSGTCCRLYPTTLFTPREARAACHHAAQAERDSQPHEGHEAGRPEDEERFTPERGSERLPWRGRAVTMIDGRCAFLAGDDRCRIHAVGGAAVKPRGCRRYPLRLVRDGRELRVAVAPECACVFDSALSPSDDPEPLLEPWPRHGRDLNPAEFVEDVPAVVAMGPGASVEREAFVSWSDAAARRFADADASTDPARWLWAEAEALDGAPDETLPGPPRDAPFTERVEAHRATLVEQLARRQALATWRSPDDLARALPAWLQAALEVPVARLTARRVGTPEEHFFVRALLFAHDPASSAPTVAEALRRRAMQLWTARRLPEAIPEPVKRRDPATRHPLALVAGYARAFGL